MFAGRFLVIVPVLCIAGMRKGRVPISVGTMPTHGLQFVALLVGTIVIVGGLTFFPALVLGPVASSSPCTLASPIDLYKDPALVARNSPGLANS
jgi:K+-transporting ATPase A subunit